MSLRNAISQGLSQLDVKTEEAGQLRHSVNKEIRPILREARKSLNALNAEPISPSVTTDGAGTYATLWTSGEMPQDAIWEIRAHVEGTASSGPRASYSIVGVFQSVAGTVSQSMPTAFDHAFESNIGCDVRFTITADRTITVDACDAATAAMTWTGTVYTPAEVVIE